MGQHTEKRADAPSDTFGTIFLVFFGVSEALRNLKPLHMVLQNLADFRRGIFAIRILRKEELYLLALQNIRSFVCRR